MSAYPKISKDVAYIDIDAAKIFVEMHKNIFQTPRKNISVVERRKYFVIGQRRTLRGLDYSRLDIYL